MVALDKVVVVICHHRSVTAKCLWHFAIVGLLEWNDAVRNKTALVQAQKRPGYFPITFTTWKYSSGLSMLIMSTPSVASTFLKYCSSSLLP